MTRKLDKQESNKPKRDSKGRLLPGQTANLNGRPKGKTMKEWVREFMFNMTEEDKKEWLKGISKEMQWKMAEGNPKQDTESDINIKLPEPIIDVDAKIQEDNSNQEDHSS